MVVSKVTRTLLACTVLGLAGATGALAAAPAADTVPAAPAIRYTLYDRTIDPTTAAIQAVLATAGNKGSFLDKRDGAAVAEYYAEQGYVPSWTADGKLTDRALAVITRIAAAATDGLDPKDFRLPDVNIGKSGMVTPTAIAEAEVMTSQAILAYAREAYAGRLDPGSVDENIGYERHLPDPLEVLSSIASAAYPAATLAAYNPPHPQFWKLRDMLAELRAKAATEKIPPTVPDGPTLKLGMSDPRVLVLRERLAVPADVDSPDVFDEGVVAAVKAFQTDAKLKPDGIVGRGTLAVLNKAAVDPTGTIIANMERWRWMPRDLGKFYVWVSLPDFMLTVHRNDKITHSTRIVIGKTTNKTPIFSDAIEYIIVNPVWNVPASIALKEMLPQARANPASLARYQVLANIGGRFRPVDPMMVDWNNVDMRKIQIKQPPGDDNALGNIKFMFPNAYAVYLHDTPSKSLFQRDYRAYSHGCMRVMDPMAFADALLVDEPGVNSTKLKSMIGGGEKRVNIARHIPVHITYFTAQVGDDGKLRTYDDLYGYDKAIEKAFGL